MNDSIGVIHVLFIIAWHIACFLLGWFSSGWFDKEKKRFKKHKKEEEIAGDDIFLKKELYDYDVRYNVYKGNKIVYWSYGESDANDVFISLLTEFKGGTSIVLKSSIPTPTGVQDNKDND